MVKRNVELLRRIADVIERDVTVYDQSAWGERQHENVPDSPVAIEEASAELVERSCGTAHCIAGHAAALSGWKPTVLVNYVWEAGMKRVELNWEEMTPPVEQKGEWTSFGTHPYSVGQDLLGLTMAEADILFDEFWHPAGTEDFDMFNGRLVADALRNFADGASIHEVTENEDGYY